MIVLLVSVTGGAQTWKIATSQCGATVAALNTMITAENVPGATAYRFNVVADGININLDRPTRTFSLNMVPGHKFGTPYQVRVAPKIGGVFQPFGPVCTVSSPTPLTQIGNQCGTTLNDMSTPIYANVIANATGYRFRITNVIDPSEVYIVDRPLREFRMNQISAKQGTTYLVDVAVRNLDGSYLPYGPACAITTPILYSVIGDQFCGHVLGAFSDVIYATIVPGAVQYRFKLINQNNPSEVKTIDRPIRSFTMNDVPGIQYETPYSVSVAVKSSNHIWLPYGDACTITTPGMPIPKIQLSQCDLFAPPPSEWIYADEIPHASVYRFRLETIGFSEEIDRPTRNFNLNMFNNLQPNTEYTVRVSVKTGNNFCSYGKACTLVTPSNIGISRMAAPGTEVGEQMDIIGFPNPFSDSFHVTIPAETKGLVKVVIKDISGRTLEQKSLAADDFRREKFGYTYPPGIYTVILEGGADKVLRMIKR